MSRSKRMSKRENDKRILSLFAVVNGQILRDLGDNISPTFTRIHFLLNGIEEIGDIDVKAIPFNQMAGRGAFSILYNNLIKTAVALLSAVIFIVRKPLVYFAYPSSFTIIQNRYIFKLANYLNLKIILDVQDTIEQIKAVGAPKDVIGRDLEDYCIRNATLILALNELMWEHILETYGLPRDKEVVFVANAFEEVFEAFYPEAYSSVQGRFNIAYVGGLTPNSGVELLADACEILHMDYPYLKLYIYGFGKASSHSLKDKIEKHDFIIQRQVSRKMIPEALAEMDLMVMPYNPGEAYLNLSSPTKLFEYIGTAKPILCTKCESLLDFGKDGSIMYADYDLTDMKEKIEILINNPRVREEMSRRLIQLRSKHTWRERARTFNEALISLSEGL